MFSCHCTRAFYMGTLRCRNILYARNGIFQIFRMTGDVFPDVSRPLDTFVDKDSGKMMCHQLEVYTDQSLHELNDRMS